MTLRTLMLVYAFCTAMDPSWSKIYMTETAEKKAYLVNTVPESKGIKYLLYLKVLSNGI